MMGSFGGVTLMSLSFLARGLLGLYSVEFGSLFVFDSVRFYLRVLSLFLARSLVAVSGGLSMMSCRMLSVSVVRSVLCYSCVKGLAF